jgi:MFS family permease
MSAQASPIDSRSRGAEAEATPTDAGARPTALLPISHLLRISAYWLGLTAIDAATGQFAQYQVTYTGIRGAIGVGVALAIISVAGPLVAIVVQPTMGSVSDYSVTRWGRRKPYIVFGSLLDVVFLVGIACSNTLLLLVAFVTLLSFSTNVARGPFQGYVPDLVAEDQVGMASAMVGLMQVAGNIVGVALISLGAVAGNRSLAILAVAVVELTTMASVVLHVGKGLPPKPRQGRPWRSIAAETWAIDILGERSYVWLVMSRLFFLMAGGILFALAQVYMKWVFGYTEAQTGAAMMAVLAAVAVGSLLGIVPASRLSDRIGRKPVIYAGCLVGAVGVGTVAAAPAIPVAVLGAGLYGTAAGVFIAVDWALMTDIIPRASAGRFMGLSNVATGSAPLLAGVVGGLILDTMTALAGEAVAPRATLVVAVALYGVAAALLMPVVEPRRGREPEIRPTATPLPA